VNVMAMVHVAQSLAYGMAFHWFRSRANRIPD
jgi:hypothetical protein